MTRLIAANNPSDADRRLSRRWPPGLRLLLLAVASAALWALAIFVVVFLFSR